jgi:hypothetical protein
MRGRLLALAERIIFTSALASSTGGAALAAPFADHLPRRQAFDEESVGVDVQLVFHYEEQGRRLVELSHQARSGRSPDQREAMASFDRGPSAARVRQWCEPRSHQFVEEIRWKRWVFGQALD